MNMSNSGCLEKKLLFLPNRLVCHNPCKKMPRFSKMTTKSLQKKGVFAL